MSKQRSNTSFTLTLDGVEVSANAGETLWQVAKRAGESIPHLCFKDASGYRADGNCRACMVEVEGERALAASCLREAAPGMVVKSASSERARTAREGVMELLLVDQPARDDSPDRSSHFWAMADQLAIDATAVRRRLPARADRASSTVHHVRLPEHSLRASSAHDASHSAMNVNLDACIECNLCVRACREVQGNDVIGLAHRGAASKIVFDFDDPMGESTCVACGECVQACPTGALMPATLIDEGGAWRFQGGRPQRRFRLPLLRGGLPAHLPCQGRRDSLRRGTRGAFQSEPVMRQGPLRLRLSAAPVTLDHATDPQTGGAQGARSRLRPGSAADSLP